MDIMREKKNYMIITFKTTTTALAMEKKCRQSSIPGRIIPLPAEISAGCGFSWRMLPEDYKEWQPQLLESGIAFEAVYQICM